MAQPVAARATAAPDDRRPITRAEIDSFKRLDVEVALSGPVGTFWVVPRRTDQDRCEYTVEEFVGILNAAELFGGARLAAVRRDGELLPDADRQAIEAAHQRAARAASAERPATTPPSRTAPPRPPAEQATLFGSRAR